MDHLLGSVLTDPSFTVPFLCDREPDYDGLDFDTYPVRRRWAASDDSRGWVDSAGDTISLARRAQAWLYFGLLEAWLGEKVDRDKFIVRGPSIAGISGTSQPSAVISGALVQRAVIIRLSAFFGQSAFEMQDDVDAQEPTLKSKFDRFAPHIFCCHQALPHSEVLDELAHLMISHAHEFPPDFRGFEVCPLPRQDLPGRKHLLCICTLSGLH